MIPEFIFEYIALNPRTATSIMIGFAGFCSIAIWIGYFKEINNDQKN